jgi:hypothetical protein
VDEVPIVGRDEAHNAFKQFQALYGAPAFVRRARGVEAALEELLGRCRRQREEWLPMVRLRLATLRELAGTWSALCPHVATQADVDNLERLDAELAPTLRVPVASTPSPRRLRQAFRELLESLQLFNRRWLAYLRLLDLGPINELREGYNRYYVLEKECALRSARLAREGFARLAPLTAADVQALLPPLPVPAEPRP